MKLISRTTKTETQFTRIDNEVLKDERLSFKAKGVMAYILSRPDDWKVRVNDLINHSTDGKTSVYSAIKELEEYGYIIREEIREKGRFMEYRLHIHEKPISKTENGNSVNG